MSSDDQGHYRCYVPKKFSESKLELITAANKVLLEYETAGFVMTLRQLYYQLITKNVFPNRLESYNRLKDAMSEGRLAGIVSWTALEDRGRNLRGLGYQRGPKSAIQNLLASYRLDLWEDQQWRPEVWIEKEALIGVVEHICMRLRVDFFACKGYNSQSEQWRAGRRFAGYVSRGQRPIVFHLGDHDPSGLDMTRDNRDRLSMFAGTPVIVSRLALNMPQIEELRPPPNPAKLTDARAAEYVAEFGESSWELDALSPPMISDLIERAVLKIRDERLWDESLAREVADRQSLEEAAELLGGGAGP